MNNEVKVFQNLEFGTVRTVTVDGEPWFVGKDVAEALGYSNTQDALARHVDQEDRSDVVIHDGSQYRTMIGINESGVYSLVFSSRLVSAKRFKRWVTSEVLPSIRKHGGYVQNQENLSDAEFMARALEMAHKVLADREKRLADAESVIAIQNQQIMEMQPKVSYYDIVLQCKNAIPITIIAKDYGWTANAMNQKLHELGIQYHIRKTWVLYDGYAKQGYTVSKTHCFADKWGRPASNVVTQWTQKGRLFIYDLLKQEGILPLCER